MPLRYLVLIIMMLATILVAGILNPGLVPHPDQLLSSGRASDDQSLGHKELELFGLINKERTRKNLKPLRGSPSLTAAARFHSSDMSRNGFFSHNSPENGGLRQRLSRFRVAYGSAGENIAEAFSVTSAHTALMKSRGHRENILSNGFSEVGIGIAYGHDGRLIITEDFSD